MKPWICPRCGKVHAGWVAECDCRVHLIAIPATCVTLTNVKSVATAFTCRAYNTPDREL
jgi:hypothetical protein